MNYDLIILSAPKNGQEWTNDGSTSEPALNFTKSKHSEVGGGHHFKM